MLPIRLLSLSGTRVAPAIGGWTWKHAFSSMPRGSRRDTQDPGSAGRKGNRAGGASGKNGDRVILDRGVYKKAKDCAYCDRVMTWRKKWESDWDHVKYCSGSCKKAGRAAEKAAKRRAPQE